MAQKAVKSAMLEISSRDRVQKEEIRVPTRVEDVIERIAKAKWEWARHVPRGDEEKWIDKLMQWKPRT